ncbi:MAG: HEAT repeat domain-containing protein [Anaerolineae bacterium]|nr:HEAT repeat domain-containing protein [Anaerolineae bacterium]
MVRQRIVWNFEQALAHLQDDDSLRAEVLWALSGASRAQASEFARVWDTLPVEQRRRAAQQMVELAEQHFEVDFNALFRHLLNDPDAQVRVNGIEGLWEDEDAALVKPFLALLRQDPDASVRAAAADAVGRFLLLAEYGRLTSTSADTLGETLLAIIRNLDEDLTVRCRALEAVAYWSDEVVRQVIATAYDDAAPQMRASAIAAMGRSADHYWRDIVARELESPDPRMRFEAARATGELENRAATATLVQLLDDPDREVQGAAITALGQVGGKLAKRALQRAAASEDEFLSALASDALQELEFNEESEFLLLDIPLDEK